MSPADAGPVIPEPATKPAGTRIDGNNQLALVSLLLGTFCGTLNNNIVNVPLKSIMTDLSVPLSLGALIVIGFNSTFAVLMPLTGWLGDRLGQRRVFLGAVITLALGAVGASLAGSLSTLLLFRMIQGAATAAILPTVMSLISQIFHGSGRARAMGLWAAANGLGQAVGPPVGGLLAHWSGWRAIFLPAVPLLLLAWAGALRWVPATRPTRAPLDRRGALLLTVGSALLITAASAVPHTGVRSPWVMFAALAGCLALIGFWVGIRQSARPFIQPEALTERSFVAAGTVAFAQMFVLGSVLLAVPLYLVTARGLSTFSAGLLVFSLPAAMTALAPVAGVASERYGTTPCLRAGILTVAIGAGALAVFLASTASTPWLVFDLVVLGSGVAFVQTPAATATSRAKAGRVGPGLGLFNLLRFAGSALGAAWISIALTAQLTFGWALVGSTMVAVLGLAAALVTSRPGKSAPAPVSSRSG